MRRSPPGAVIVRDDLSPTQVHDRVTERMAELAAQEPRGFSADVLRELHAQGTAPQSARSVSADAMRELKGSTEVQRSAPVAVHDDLSPSRGGDTAPSSDTVDDDLSPIGGSF